MKRRGTLAPSAADREANRHLFEEWVRRIERDDRELLDRLYWHLERGVAGLEAWERELVQRRANGTLWVGSPSPGEAAREAGTGQDAPHA